MTQFIQNKEGLKPEHQNENPLFEKSYFPPDYGEKQVSRLYADGSLYFFTPFEKSPESNENDGKWDYISTVNNSGLKNIKKLVEKTGKLKSDKIEGENVKGIVTWKVSFKKGVIEILTTIIPESKHKVFNVITNLVNTNLNPIPSD